ncbi:MAG: amino acid adenylation domain-containing protein [Gammaproteobacteria bacterium]|jgi:amino acid adenylation domain-containing protein|nr:amino acid adenylation domain-containing protein [Gammaproteobacteria bacterium]
MNLGTQNTANEDQAFEAVASFAQQRLWFLDQLEPGSAVYNISVAWCLHGPLQPEALQQAIDLLLARHETLRTTFDRTDNLPVQVVADTGHVALERVALQSPVDAQLRELARRPFDLRHGPLLRVTLLSQDPGEHVLLLCIHHIVADAWSLDILYRELAEAYTAALTGDTCRFPVLEVQYADFAEWQQDWLRGDELERQLSYWRQRLAGAPGLLSLPTDRPRPRVQDHAGANLQRPLPTKLAAALRQLAQDHSCTLFHLYFAAFAALLSRWAATADLVIGTPIAGRQRSELEGLVGFFVNTLAMRIELDDDPTFTTLLRRVRDDSLQAYAHQDLPFEKLVEELEPERATSYAPLFQVLFVLQHAGGNSAAFGDLEAEVLLVESGTAKFDLTLFVTAATSTTSLLMEYNTALFDATTIELMLAHLERLLSAIAADPQCPVSRIPLLGEQEAARLLNDFNATARDLPPFPVARLVEQQAQRTPADCAIVAGTAELSYAELDTRADALAAALQTHGAQHDTRVVVCMPRSIDLVVAVLAVMKSGAACVPVDPDYPAARRARILAMAQPVAAVTAEAGGEWPSGTAVVALDRFDWRAPATSTLHGAGEIAYVLFTSGSTGEPKGVEMTHAGLSNLVQWQISQPRLAVPARTLQFASLSFDVSFQEIFTTWAQGGCLVLVDAETRRDMAALARHLTMTGTERLYLPFAALSPLVDALLTGAQGRPALRDVIVAGEQLQITPALRELFANLDDACLHNHYGPTETHVVTACTLAGDPAGWPALPPIGRPLANTRAYVLDHHQQPVPVGVPGELHIAGVQVARGYLGRAELTAERFIDDPFASQSGTRMYRTGDRARWRADGQLEYLGRTDQQLKWRGYRIEPGEIEASLTQHPAVLQSAVVLREDTPGDPRLIAYVVGATAEPDIEELRAHLRAQLPAYMLPSQFVVLQSLPLTPSGKLARNLLPRPEAAAPGSDPVAPRTVVETRLVRLWCDVLGLEQVGIHDDFFHLGGHSLLATQLISRIRDAFGIEVPLIELFDKPTVAEFAPLLPEPAAAAPAAIPCADRRSSLPLSFAQQRLWFLDQLEPGNSAYNFPVALALQGQLDIGCLEQALQALTERHESLRTVFSGTATDAAQQVLPACAVQLQQATVPADRNGREAELRRLTRVPFDLQQGPLLRAHLLRVAASDTHILLLVMHHIVTDGWSLNIILTELAALYAAAVHGQPSPLPALPVQYADYASWQRAWLQGDELERQLSFWRKALADMPPVLELPLDYPRPAEQTYHGSSVFTVIPRPLLLQLQALARRENCTLYMLLLAAFDVLLAKYAGTTELVVGTPIAGRQRSELESLIGYFSNTLAIPARLDAEDRFTEFLRGVKQATLDAYAHQDLPFEKLVEELQPERSLSHPPIFQVMFVLQNAPLSAVQFDTCDATLVGFEMGIAKFDLLLEVAETRDGLRAGLQYNSDLFAAASMERMLNHLHTLLAAIIERPETRLKELPLISPSARRQALQALARPPVDYPPTRVQCLVEEQAVRTPDRLAVEMAGRGWSYAELNARANRLCRQLQAQGTVPGQRIGICMERSLQMTAGVLSILKAGAAYVSLDPGYPASRIEAMLADADVELVLTQAALRAALPHSCRTLVVDDSEALPPRDDTAAANPPPTGDSVYVIFTSGSTGRAKGVELTHAGVSNLVQWQNRQPGLDTPARTLQFASLSFDVSFQELFTTWAQGGTVVLVDEDERRDFTALTQLLESARIERLYLPCAALQPLANAALAAAPRLPLRDVIVAGEQLQITPDVRALFAALPGTRLHNHYGPSETHVITSHTLGVSPADWPVLPPIGRPVDNTAVYVLDADGQPVPPGIPGELCAAGVQVATGYVGNPALNAGRFSKDPFGPEGRRMYRTGDRVRLNGANELEYCGRADSQFKWRGYRIEPGEIEAVLSAHADVAQAAVLLREDRPGDPQLVAYAATGNRNTAAAVLRDHLAAQLPPYMVPALIVTLPELPLTPSGKLDRRALPAPQQVAATLPYRAPATPLEQLLTEQYAAVLNIERVSSDADFFQLGGHSLLATRLISRIRDAAGIELPLKDVFRHPTPARLAARIGALQTAADLRVGASQVADDDREQFEL